MAKKKIAPRGTSRSKPAGSKPAGSKSAGSKSSSGTKGAPRKSVKSGGSKSGRSKSATAKKPNDPRQRLQRIMASAGIGSRRECELIIEEGRVEIDGEIVMTLGVKVDPSKQEIYVDAQKLVIQRLQYFMLNKPPGIVSTSKDPSGRPRVIDLIDTDKRVYNVGRLDQSSEGLILVTNDGDLANRLTHPRYGVEKRYHVQVAGIPAAAELRQLEQGVYLAEGVARASKVKFLKKSKSGCWLEITLDEGRNREIRRLLASIGHKVRTLKRVAIGPLLLGDLPKGAHRPLMPVELKALQRATEGGAKPRKKRGPRKATGLPRADRSTSASDGPKRGAGSSRTGPGASRTGAGPRKKTKSRRPSAAGSRGADKGQKSGGKPARGRSTGASAKKSSKPGRSKGR